MLRWFTQVCILFGLTGLIFCTEGENDLVKYQNPGLAAGMSSEEITSTVANRCNLYPRCLMFRCCTSTLESHVVKYFSSQGENSKQRQYACMFEEPSTCNYQAPLTERMKNHPMLDVVFTKDRLFDGLAALPPTPPDVFERLHHRKQFKVLYLAQGPVGRSKTSEFIRTHKDLLYLTYMEESREAGDFYFPKSTLAMGRMALALAARMLELQQGWQYNYIVSMDYDAQPDKDAATFISLFEWELFSWKPAVGFTDYNYNPAGNNKRIASTYWQDFIYMAYHREVLEILHSWILDFDHHCHWASQVMETLEHTTVYRNHIHLYNVVGKISNSNTGTYAKDCLGDTGSFRQTWQNHLQAIQGFPKPCRLVETDGQFWKSDANNALFGPLRPLGRNRLRLTPYHLMHLNGTGDYRWLEAQPYLYCTENGWDQNRWCCSLDANYAMLADPRVKGLPVDEHAKKYHDSIVRHTRRNINNGEETSLFYVWNGKRHILRYHQMVRDMGFDESIIADIDDATLALLEAADSKHI